MSPRKYQSPTRVWVCPTCEAVYHGSLEQVSAEHLGGGSEHVLLGVEVRKKPWGLAAIATGEEVSWRTDEGVLLENKGSIQAAQERLLGTLVKNMLSRSGISLD